MKPAPFGYERPRDLQAALAVLAEADASAKIIAGGQSLGPMLNLRLVEPGLIVDISRLAELKQVEHRGDELVLGACVTHADIEDGRIPDVTRGAMRGVAANIAYRAVRNRGGLDVLLDLDHLLGLDAVHFGLAAVLLHRLSRTASSPLRDVPRLPTRTHGEPFGAR